MKLYSFRYQCLLLIIFLSGCGGGGSAGGRGLPEPIDIAAITEVTTNTVADSSLTGFAYSLRSNDIIVNTQQEINMPLTLEEFSTSQLIVSDPTNNLSEQYVFDFSVLADDDMGLSELTIDPFNQGHFGISSSDDVLRIQPSSVEPAYSVDVLGFDANQAVNCEESGVCNIAISGNARSGIVNENFRQFACAKNILDQQVSCPTEIGTVVNWTSEIDVLALGFENPSNLEVFAIVSDETVNNEIYDSELDIPGVAFISNRARINIPNLDATPNDCSVLPNNLGNNTPVQFTSPLRVYIDRNSADENITEDQSVIIVFTSEDQVFFPTEEIVDNSSVEVIVPFWIEIGRANQVNGLLPNAGGSPFQIVDLNNLVPSNERESGLIAGASSAVLSSVGCTIEEYALVYLVGYVNRPNLLDLIF